MENIVTKKSSINNFVPSIMILLFLGVFVYYIGSSSIAMAATLSSLLNTTNNTTIKSISNNETVVSTNSQNLLYESKEGTISYWKVINVIGEPQIEVSVITHGILNGVGNVTNIETWVNTYRTSNIIYGEGKGIMISENGQMAPWIGYGVGQLQNNGTILFKDIIFFSNNATGNMKFLDNVIGLHISTVQGNNQTTTIFKWQ